MPYEGRKGAIDHYSRTRGTYDSEDESGKAIGPLAHATVPSSHVGSSDDDCNDVQELSETIVANSAEEDPPRTIIPPWSINSSGCWKVSSCEASDIAVVLNQIEQDGYEFRCALPSHLGARCTLIFHRKEMHNAIEVKE